MSREDLHRGTPQTSVGKGFAVLEALAATSRSLGVTEIANRSNMPKSTTYRLLALMIEHRYVVKEAELYRLAERVFELGHRVQIGTRLAIREIAAPYVAELYAATRKTVHLGVLSGADVLYLDKIGSPELPRLPTRVGARRPVYATGLGKVLVAFAGHTARHSVVEPRFRRATPYTIADLGRWQRTLSQVQEMGVAHDNEESFLGVSCRAVPILDPENGTAIAALSISAPANGVGSSRMNKALNSAAQQIARALPRS